MLKKSSKIHYTYKGQKLPINKIFGICKKRRRRSKYLLSVNVTLGEEQIPAKIVCVRNRNNKKEWIALICTNTTLPEEEIIRIYGKRWQIEIFFKTCKSYLKLVKECHSLSYDALTAHVAIVFARYMLLALEQRRNLDEKTLGKLFFYMVDELKNIAFAQSYQLILQTMIDCVCAIFQPSDEQLSQLLDMFIENLQDYLKIAITRPVIAA